MAQVAPNLSVIAQLSRVNLLLNNKSGRDKLYKTLQYLLKLFLELAHLKSIEHPWLPHLKRFSVRLSQTRALFRLGSFLSDLERLEKMITKEAVSWAFLQKLVTATNVFISNTFDSIVTVNGIIRRDTSFSQYYSTLFWLFGILGDIFKDIQILKSAIEMEARWKKRNRPETQTLPEGEQALTTEPKIDIKAVRKVKIESIIGIVKSFCDAVTAMSILHPVTIGKYRIFICSCGLFAGSVGLIQNWNAIKA